MENLAHHPIDSRILSPDERESIRPISTVEVCERAKELGLSYSYETVHLHHVLDHAQAADDIIRRLLDAGSCQDIHPETGASCLVYSPETLCEWCEQSNYVKNLLGAEYLDK